MLAVVQNQQSSFAAQKIDQSGAQGVIGLFPCANGSSYRLQHAVGLGQEREFDEPDPIAKLLDEFGACFDGQPRLACSAHSHQGQETSLGEEFLHAGVQRAGVWIGHDRDARFVENAGEPLKVRHWVKAHGATMMGKSAAVPAALQRLQDMEDNTKNSISDLTGVDYAQALSDYSTQSAAYQAALKVGAQIIQPSLLQFLG